MTKKSDYYCGPQHWPRWFRKPLSKYYNRACREHDNDYGSGELSRSVAELKFRKEIIRKRKAIKKAWKVGKLTFIDLVFHGIILSRVIPITTKLFGRNFFKKKR